MRSLLFICTGNSCRSQMAEAWARRVLPEGWRVYSAGVEKHGLNPMMLRVMEEAGVDMAAHVSKTISELPAAEVWSVVVTVCGHAAAQCPYFPAAAVQHMPFDDPPALAAGLPEVEALAVYRRVRDEIRAAVENLAQTLISDEV